MFFTHRCIITANPLKCSSVFEHFQFQSKDTVNSYTQARIFKYTLAKKVLRKVFGLEPLWGVRVCWATSILDGKGTSFFIQKVKTMFGRRCRGILIDFIFFFLMEVESPPPSPGARDTWGVYLPLKTPLLSLIG